MIEIHKDDEVRFYLPDIAILGKSYGFTRKDLMKEEVCYEILDTWYKDNYDTAIYYVEDMGKTKKSKNNYYVLIIRGVEKCEVWS